MPHRCWAEIDLAAFERNLKSIQAALPPHTRYISVVKADAYGHGMPQIVRRLMQSGIDSFAVANVSEAADIRHMGAGWPILILSPVLPNEEPFVADYDLTVTISTREEVDRFEQLGRLRNKSIQVHLKIDTGMGRLGVWHENAAALLAYIKQCKRLQLTGIYTHFSSADVDRDFTQLQRKRLLQIVEPRHIIDKEIMIHADNSASIDSLSSKSAFNGVRIGLLQFGLQPYTESAFAHVKVEPVFSFHTRVGLIKSLPSGTDISYLRTYRLTRNSKIAVLTAGYGDGVPINLSNKGSVLIHGHRYPIIGRVTMDQTIIDVTGATDIVTGDRATLIGKSGKLEIPCSEFSALAATIPWETLCSITKRVARVYLGAREI